MNQGKACLNKGPLNYMPKLYSLLVYGPALIFQSSGLDTRARLYIQTNLEFLKSSDLIKI